MRPLLSSVLIFIWCIGFALADSKQQEGERLVSDAIQLSNIRADGSSGFRIKTIFKLADGSGTTLGAYTQTWISREQWRNELEIRSFRRIEAARLHSRWVRESSDNAPAEATDILHSVDLKTLPRPMKVTKIVDKNFNGAVARCVWSETMFQVDVYCIDTKNGSLLSYENLWRGGKKSHVAYIYRDYETFGDHIFPRSVEEDREGEPAIVGEVAELSPEVSVDESVFKPLPGDIEVSNCLTSQITLPRADIAPIPRFPMGHDQHPFVMLSLIVDSGGKPEHVRITRSGGVDYDSEATKAIESWTFRPAQCDGKNVAMQISLGFDFHSARRIGGMY